jgi:hypothetical protein
MVHEARRVRPMFRKRSQHLAMHSAGTFALNCAKHGKPRQLVAESD